MHRGSHHQESFIVLSYSRLAQETSIATLTPRTGVHMGNVGLIGTIKSQMRVVFAGSWFDLPCGE
jgi:hypothetical protein